jgi:hypothetical protein
MQPVPGPKSAGTLVAPSAALHPPWPTQTGATRSQAVCLAAPCHLLLEQAGNGSLDALQAVG